MPLLVDPADPADVLGELPAVDEFRERLQHWHRRVQSVTSFTLSSAENRDGGAITKPSHKGGTMVSVKDPTYNTRDDSSMLCNVSKGRPA